MTLDIFTNRHTLLSNAFLLVNIAVNGSTAAARSEALNELCKTGQTMAEITPAWPHLAEPALAIADFCTQMDPDFSSKAIEITLGVLPYACLNPALCKTAHGVFENILADEQRFSSPAVLEGYRELAAALTKPNPSRWLHSPADLPDPMQVKKDYLVTLREQGLTEKFLPNERMAQNFSGLCKKMLLSVLQRRLRP